MKYNNRLIAIDTETGGLPNKEKQATIDIALTEVAMVVVDSEKLEITEKHSWLIKPYSEDCIYSDGAAKASGITKAMVEAEGLEIEEVYKSMKSVLQKNKLGKLKPILILQNSDFDLPFLVNLFAIFEDDFMSYIERVEDTLDWARITFGEKPNFKLGSIAEYCGIELVEAHRALPDTVTTAQIFLFFLKRLRGEAVHQKTDVKKERPRSHFNF